MAEKDEKVEKAEKALKKLDEHVKCPICLDTFKEPKQLSCRHVYCKDCLVELSSRDRQGKLTLTCPNCRQLTPIPASGVASLEPAFQTSTLIDIKDAFKNVDHSSIAEAADDASTDDEAIPVAKVKSKVLPYCSEHTDQEVKAYCNGCESFLCIKCVILNAKHYSHDYKMLDWYQEQIVSALEPVKEGIATIAGSVEMIDGSCKDIADQRAVMEAEIDRAIGSVIEALENRRAELKQQLHQFTQRKLKALAAQKDVVESTQMQFQRCQESVEQKLVPADMRDLVQNRDESSQLIAELLSAFDPALLKPSTSADASFSVTKDLSRLCQSYGALSVGELMPDPSQCFVTDLRLLPADVPATLTMQAINHWGEPCRNPFKSSKFVFVSDVTNKGVQGSLTRISEGLYEVRFTPIIKGQHHLHVSIDGQPIRGSPFAVGVKSSVKTLGSPILRIPKIASPWGVAVSGKKEIVVTEHAKHCISVFNLSGKKLRSFGTQGSGEGEFVNPRGVAVDDADHILVADRGNHRIQMFAEDGRFLKQVGTRGTGPLQFEEPNAIAFNFRNRQFYVVDKTSRIQILSDQLTYCDSFGGVGKGGISFEGIGFEGFGKGKLGPDVWGLCCDSAGLVHVADRASNRVMTFSADGQPLKTVGERFFGVLKDPVGVASDANCLLYVSNRFGDNVVVITHEGELVKAVGRVGTKLEYPRGVAVDDCGVVYVCDNDNNRVCLY